MASSSNPESQAIYDIFLSFRGPDTRKKFTDRLYETLKEKGYNPFRDKEGVETGENLKSELRKAIENSRISIIVFSKTYTTSTACLFEIRTIIEQREKNRDYVIVPVYYEVDPAEIKKQARDLDKVTGVEVEVEGKKVVDFEGKKVTVEKLKEWSAALMKVACLRALVSGDLSERYEAEFIAEIVAVVEKKQAGNYRDLKENLLNLKHKVEYLSGQENDINSKISSEEGPWQRPKKEIEVWLTHVQRCKDKVQRLEEKVHGEMDLSLRVCLGKKITEMSREVSELQEKCNGFVSLLIDDNPIGRLPHPLPIDFVISTIARNRERIWECLVNDDVGAIGVFGMGGVGKTTIMKHIHNQLLEETDKLVFWVTVSKTSGNAKLQSDIAKAVNLDLGDQDEEVIGRALRLHAHLSKQRSYVLILDDVWEPFHLDEVGIPKPTRSNGCKLVLTTRSLEACDMMGWEPIKVDLLTEEEARNLFLTKAVGHGKVLPPDMQKIAYKISKRCARLPFAIITIARSLRGLREIHDWRNALRELTTLTRDACDVTTVLEQLQFSYNRLGDAVLRDCFLYCSLYPEDDDIKVDNLIEYWIAEGLISDNNSVEAQFDEGHAILKKLTRRCLLESFIDDTFGAECVRMHDLIRDMALKITLSSPRFLVEAGKRLESIPSEDWPKDLDRVSFMGSCIRNFPDTLPLCSQLATLLLNRIELSKISDCFNMPRLKVLDLSHNRIKSLPESISKLTTLQALILKFSSELKYVPSLKDLKALKQFSLSHSMIEELPKGVEELVNLRKLDLGHNRKLGEFPSCKLSGLSKLQYLEIFMTRLGVSAGHLLCLRQLRVVAVQFQNVQQFNDYVKSKGFQGLEKYRIFAGGYPRKDIRYGKQVTLWSNSGALGSGLDDLVLPADLDYLCLCNFNDPISLSAIPCMKDARDLRQCDVQLCMGLESIFSSSIFSKDGQIVLGTVKTLDLDTLPKFRVLFNEIPPPHNIFFNLENLCIRNCHAVKNIFPFQLLRNFPSLNFLSLTRCNNLRDIIVEEEEISDWGQWRDGVRIITLPKLKALTLQSLPCLRSIYDGMMECECLEVVDIRGCPMLSRLPFSLHMDSEQVTALPAVRAITAEDEWWDSLTWVNPLTKTNLQPYFKGCDIEDVE